MYNLESLKDNLRSMPGCSEVPHFEKTAYRTKKRIFASLEENGNTLTVKLSPVQQSVYTGLKGVAKVPNKWGEQGWTNININETDPDIMLEMCRLAYLDALK